MFNIFNFAKKKIQKNTNNNLPEKTLGYNLKNDNDLLEKTLERDLNNDLIIQINDKKKNFDLENIEGNFYVESVYDGDTITILVPTKLTVYNMISSNTIVSQQNLKEDKIILNQVKVRLYGIDTPELKSSLNIPNREEYIKKANEAKKFLLTTILNKIIRVKFLLNDKYGRPLAIIYHNNIDINQLMIEKGFAKSYDGGKKNNDF